MKTQSVNKKIIIFFLAAASACMAFAVWELYLRPGEAIAYVDRNPAGEAGSDVELKAVVEGEKPVSVSLNVPSVQFTEEEADACFAGTIRKLAFIFPGEGNRIEQDLSLPSSFPDDPVSIEWQSSHPAVLSSAGKIGDPESTGEEVTLTARMTLGDFEEKYIVHLTVFPKKDKEGTAGAAVRETERINEGSTDSRYYLPEEVNGRAVIWYKNTGSRAGTLAVILVLAALLLVVRERKQLEEQDKKRNEALKAAYPELISMVLLLSCAGLSLRKIMYRIAGRRKRHTPAFEEIGRVCADMENGIGETEAYERLGNRCAGAGYRTFAMLLARSTVRGSAGMQAELEQEVQSALEDSRRRAKAAGEIAAVKLLLPMAMMLAVVMIVVLVPSFLSFTG